MTKSLKRSNSVIITVPPKKSKSSSRGSRALSRAFYPYKTFGQKLNSYKFQRVVQYNLDLYTPGSGTAGSGTPFINVVNGGYLNNSTFQDIAFQFSLSTVFIASGGIYIGSGLAVPAYGDFTALFDMYRISRVNVEVKFSNTNSDILNITAPGSGSGTVSSNLGVIPTIWSAVDYNTNSLSPGASTNAVAALGQYSNVKRTTLYNRTARVSFKPRSFNTTTSTA